VDVAPGVRPPEGGCGLEQLTLGGSAATLSLITNTIRAMLTHRTWRIGYALAGHDDRRAVRGAVAGRSPVKVTEAR
jgi:hypothetical protein